MSNEQQPAFSALIAWVGRPPAALLSSTPESWRIVSGLTWRRLLVGLRIRRV